MATAIATEKKGAAGAATSMLASETASQRRLSFLVLMDPPFAVTGSVCPVVSGRVEDASNVALTQR